MQENSNGNTIYQYMDGTQVTHVARTGEKIYVYPDGSTKQVDADGGGVIVDEAGQQTDFKEGGDKEFETKRLAKAKEPLDESLENRASTDEEDDSAEDTTKHRDNFWATLRAERNARKDKGKFLANANRKRKEKRKNKTRRMVPKEQPKQVPVAPSAASTISKYSFDADNSFNPIEQFHDALLGGDTPSDMTSVASAETLNCYDPMEDCDPDRCCWMDITPTPKSE